MVPFLFSGREMHLVDGRAVHWPDERALLVADLHLEKASWFARGGQMLPPYDSRETLERLADAIRKTGARRVFALGDNFHDSRGNERLDPHAAGMLAALTRAVDWIWITGNHDEALVAHSGGVPLPDAELGGIILRHKAHPDERRPEFSGHFHPKIRLKSRGRSIARACAVRSERRMILPAFGALTGGMDATSPEILSAMQPAHAIDAILPATGKLVQFPLWRSAT
ncbi:ligase-associated DNA damage response endonuclease PdeM [Novosphingobium aquimarinum]|uniref:ligase-associated DNA damage response endonuclease PdeM n=1 Tax=Novosphingobium aquimarinum TaxID=2682494 RepID=UPI0012EC9FE1|nr:ligase-associated DNA damage response endonuclease PdeM [Novosphingobium aquimarinum]